MKVICNCKTQMKPLVTIEFPCEVGYDRSTGISITIEKDYEQYYTIDELDSTKVYQVHKCPKCNYVYIAKFDKE